MPQKFSNFARGSLSAGILAADTTLTINSGGSLFPVANTGAATVTAATTTDWYRMVLQDAAGNYEIVLVRTHTASSNTMSDIVRGQEGTTAQTWGAGTTVAIRPTAADADAWASVKSLATYAYDSRATLRTLSPTNGDFANVQDLGLFRFETGSTQPDDDETCFATATGCWLIEAAHPDMVYAHQFWGEEEQDARLEDAETRLTTAETGSSIGLKGSVTSTLTSLSATALTDFNATVTGAAVGDTVLLTPRNALGSSAGDQCRLFLVGYVSAANTVTVSIRNPSASSVTLVSPTVIDVRVLKA